MSDGRNIGPLLDLKSTPQEALRSLFYHGAEFFAVSDGSVEFLCHKDALIALLERGDEGESLGCLIHRDEADSMQGKMSLEAEPSDKRVLVLDADGLCCKTVIEFRQSRLTPKAEPSPAWWSIPLPMMRFSDHCAALNPRGRELVPLEGEELDRLAARALAGGDMVLHLPEAFGGGAFAMTMIDRDTFFLEDISGDAEMAEKLVRWAAVGQAFVNRMEKNGLIIRQHREGESLPEDALEVIPCHWEGNMLGFISIAQGEIAAEEKKTEQKAEPKAIKRKRKTEHESTARKKTGRVSVSDG